MQISEPERVAVYIDGFNLYFGIVQSGLEEFKWLDVIKLSKSCLKPNQLLVDVNYFTSNLTKSPGKEKRQRTYLDAIAAKGAKIIRGKYENRLVTCKSCSYVWNRYSEKMTDVNIATALIMDALNNKYDVAILVSGDSDLIPAINAVNNNFSPKIVTVIFQPGRQNSAVKNAVNGSYQLGRKRLQDCQMDEQVISTSGYLLEKPLEWRI